MSSIRERARAEMERAKYPAEDIAAVDKCLEIFFSHFNSGGAVSVMAPVLSRLIAGAPLSPLTGDEDEWADMSSYEGAPAGTCLQNKRASSIFKRKNEDGEYVVTDVNEPGENGRGFKRIASFPHMPEAVVGSPIVAIGKKED